MSGWSCLSLALKYLPPAAQLKDPRVRSNGRTRWPMTKASRQASPGCRPARQGACVSGDGGHGRVQWRRCDSSGCWRILGSSEVFRNTALQQHDVEMAGAFDDDCISVFRIMQRWANSHGLGVRRIPRERCGCGRNTRRMYTGRVSEGLACCCSSNATRASRLIFEGSCVSRSPVGFGPCVTRPRGVPETRAVPIEVPACTDTTLSRATEYFQDTF